MGNSEVGHLNIGAGRVVMQDLPRVSDAVESGGLAQIPALNAFIEALRQSGGACHLLGLVSPGGVHSHQDHAAALAAYVASAGVRTYLHAFTDGRDTPPRSSDEDLKRLLAALPPSVTVATVCGRYYAMDRDNRWERVSRAYDLLVSAQAPRFPDPLAVVADAYAHDKSDEFIDPAVVGDYQGMKDGDGVLCFNFQEGGAFRRRRRPHPIQHRPRPLHEHPLRAPEPRQCAGQGGGGCGPHPAAHGRDREISPCHLFPQWRRGAALCGRGPHHGPLPQGGDL
jgi:bisphosphoglycerate-independent phosphoglycerate mutase